MKDFTFHMPTRVVFGEGVSLRLDQLCEEYGAKKVLLVTDTVIKGTEGFRNLELNLSQKGIEIQVYDETVPEPPVETVDRAAGILKESGSQMVIAVGGGSVIDTAKAMCLLCTNEGSVRDYLFGGSRTIQRRPLPLICVSTTAGSGSEVTASSVISDPERDVKLSVTHPWLFPLVAVVDPVLHCAMPLGITASTGMDALTHAVEAYVSRNAQPMSDALALHAVFLIGQNIRKAAYQPDCQEARSNMALASLLAASAFVSAGLGAVHGISQSLGGVAHISHGVANALLLPYVCEVNLAGNVERFARLGTILGENQKAGNDRRAAESFVTSVRTLLEDLRLPRKLKPLGVPRESFPKIVKGALEYRLMPLNPVPLKEKDIEQILERAYE